MSYLRDLLILPKAVTRNDFVVDLTGSVDHPEALLDRYAITPGIAHAFEQAVTHVREAMDGKRNAAAYVAASFGAGKSQFMGVLSAMLAGHPAPKARPELHPVYEKHPWLGQKPLLRLHYNMMGARSMEDRIFRTYLDHLARNHPQAPLPALFEDEGLFKSADAYLADVGPEKFLAKLNGAQPAAAGLGGFAAKLGWNLERYRAARSSRDPEKRAELLSALGRIDLFAGRLESERFVDLSRGLRVLSTHAAALGYTGVVLFLDELVLWFASIAGNADLLSREIGKLSNLVEGRNGVGEGPPIGCMSFIARQRQLIDLVGEHYAGEDAVRLRDQLQFWRERIDEIKLEDRNLPAIIEKKVVVPKDEAARNQLAADFEKARRRLRENEWGTLLGELQDGSAFQKVFPFSPALVEALVALSQCLQRERTAIRILVEMLVERLEDFQSGQLVPIGDLFDVLAAGDEPMDLVMRQRFQSAKRLYDYELLPLIQQANRTTDASNCQRFREDDPSRGCSNCPEKRCRADNRLVKTLLLAALTPEVATLKNMTARKLVALNHGALPTVIPGTEWSDAVARLRNLAASNGKVRVGDQGDPTVAVVLEGVDLKPILEQASVHNTFGARERKVREVLYTAMGLATGEGAQALVDHSTVWRGTDRSGQVYLSSLKRIGDEGLLGREKDDFRVVIGLPFEEAGFGPADAEQKLQELIDAGKTAPTVVWLPSHISQAVQQDLGELVIIDQLLGPGQLTPYFANRAPDDLSRARAELQALSEQKRQRLRRALLAAYGLKADEGELAPDLLADRHYAVLLPGVEVRGLVAADLPKALEESIRELLDARWPRHAVFRGRLTRGRLEKALRIFERLCDTENGRLQVNGTEEDELGPAEALGLVQIGGGVAVLRPQVFQDWKQQLLQAGEEQPSLERLHALADPNGATGHREDVLDFMVLAFAAATHRDVVAGDGRPIAAPVMGKLPQDARVVEVELPEETTWQKALERAAKLFGVSPGGKARNPANLNELVTKVRAARDDRVGEHAGGIAALLDRRAEFFSGDPARLKTARAAENLLAALQTQSPVAMVKAMADAKPGTSLEALARHLVDAAAIAHALENEMAFGSFKLLEGRPGEAALILDEVRKALEADELLVPLAPRLSELGQRALDVLRPAPPPPGVTPRPPVPVPPTPPPAPPGSVVASGAATSLAELDTARDRIADALKAPGAKLTLTWTVTRS